MAENKKQEVSSVNVSKYHLELLDDVLLVAKTNGHPELSKKKIVEQLIQELHGDVSETVDIEALRNEINDTEALDAFRT
jgi:hypothetical protein